MLKQLPIYSPEEFESQKHPFSIKRLSTTIGAELLDIDLKKDLSQEEKDHIYNALLTYKVIFFRDQDISTEQHMRFGQYFGRVRNSSLSHLLERTERITQKFFVLHITKTINQRKMLGIQMSLGAWSHP